MSQNMDRLRRALEKPPANYNPKPTSVPSTITLEEILTRAQNRFRRPRETWIDRLRRLVRRER